MPEERYEAYFEIPEGEAPFRLALGNFICHYAGLERMVHTLFHSLSGMKQEVAKSIIGGMRFIDVLGALSRVVDLSDIPEQHKREFHGCIEHLHHISNFRHALIHRGGFSGPEEITSTNAITAKSPEAVEIWRFAVADIDAAARDAHAMSFRMWVLLYPQVQKFFAGHLTDMISGPWRYKPLRPERPNQPPPKARR